MNIYLRKKKGKTVFELPEEREPEKMSQLIVIVYLNLFVIAKVPPLMVRQYG